MTSLTPATRATWLAALVPAALALTPPPGGPVTDLTPATVALTLRLVDR